MQRAHHGWRFRAMLAGIYVALVAMPHLLSFSQKEIAVFLVINVLVVVSYRLLTLTGEWSARTRGAHGGRRLCECAAGEASGRPGSAGDAAGRRCRRPGRLGPELSPVPDEGVLLSHRVLRGRRDHQVVLETVPRALRWAEGHQAHSLGSRRRDRRPGDCVLRPPSTTTTCAWPWSPSRWSSSIAWSTPGSG